MREGLGEERILHRRDNAMTDNELSLISTIRVLIDRITLLEARLAQAELSVARLEVGHGIMPLLHQPIPISPVVPPIIPPTFIPIPIPPMPPHLSNTPAYKCPGCHKDIPAGQWHTCISCHVNQDPNQSE